VHRRAWFLPDHLYQTRLLAEAYEKSDRRTTYLGDWHSHPNGPQRLSDVDRNTLRRIARSVQQRSRSDHPAMMLLLSGPPWVTMISLGYVRDERWWRPSSLRVEHIANTRVHVVT
jgi:integrative and conjugative element protein (TIGR02256 family)